MNKLCETEILTTLVFGAVWRAAGNGVAYAAYNRCGNGYGNGSEICNQHVETTADSAETKVYSTGDYGAHAAIEDTDLTLEEMLIYAMQDEYKARMEYEVIMDQYGQQRPFSNIKSAEETHISALESLFENYNISIPEDESENYIIYPTSLNEAYKTGMKAEIDNIAMYDRFLQEDLPKDVRTVFTSLRNASVKHLNAFQRHVRGSLIYFRIFY